jgi:hypothetical protein
MARKASPGCSLPVGGTIARLGVSDDSEQSSESKGFPRAMDRADYQGQHQDSHTRKASIARSDGKGRFMRRIILASILPPRLAISVG